MAHAHQHLRSVWSARPPSERTEVASPELALAYASAAPPLPMAAQMLSESALTEPSVLLGTPGPSSESRRHNQWRRLSGAGAVRALAQLLAISAMPSSEVRPSAVHRCWMQTTRIHTERRQLWRRRAISDERRRRWRKEVSWQQRPLSLELPVGMLRRFRELSGYACSMFHDGLLPHRRLVAQEHRCPNARLKLV